MKQEFEYIAKAPSSGQPKKLVFLFHGYGLDARAMQKMADILAEEIEDVLVIMPHAPERFRMPEADDNVLRVPEQLAKTVFCNLAGNGLISQAAILQIIAIRSTIWQSA